MVLNLLVQNVAQFLSAPGVMSGGKNAVSSVKQSPNFFLLMLFTLLILLVKGLIVYLAYNMLMPKLIYSISKDKNLEEIEENFKPLSYIESVIFVILANTLFSG